MRPSPTVAEGKPSAGISKRAQKFTATPMLSVLQGQLKYIESTFVPFSLGPRGMEGVMARFVSDSHIVHLRRGRDYPRLQQSFPCAIPSKRRHNCFPALGFKGI